MWNWAEALIAAVSITAFIVFGTYLISWGGA
jgi:hypothetical protein